MQSLASRWYPTTSGLHARRKVLPKPLRRGSPRHTFPRPMNLCYKYPNHGVLSTWRHTARPRTSPAGHFACTRGNPYIPRESGGCKGVVCLQSKSRWLLSLANDRWLTAPASVTCKSVWGAISFAGNSTKWMNGGLRNRAIKARRKSPEILTSLRAAELSPSNFLISLFTTCLRWVLHKVSTPLDTLKNLYPYVLGCPDNS